MDIYDENIVREFPEYSHSFLKYNKYKLSHVLALAAKLNMPISVDTCSFDGLDSYTIGTGERTFRHQQFEELPKYIRLDVMDEEISSWNLITIPANFINTSDIAQGHIPDNLYRLISCYYGEDWPKTIPIEIYFDHEDGTVTKISPQFKIKL